MMVPAVGLVGHTAPPINSAPRRLQRTPLLADLREPPVPGKFYMVPVVEAKWHGIKGVFPVRGPLHHDRDFFNFPYVHFHVDYHFVAEGPLARVWETATRPVPFLPSDTVTQASPLHFGLKTRVPRLARRKCRRLDGPCTGLEIGFGKKFQPFVDAYAGKPAIRRPDGRLLCPHRKVDLSQQPVDADGMVTCPLHGLRVCVR